MRESFRTASKQDKVFMTTTQRMIDIPRPPVTEKAIVARLILPEENDREVEESLAELRELARTAGAVVCGTITQRRARPEPSTLIGEGKVNVLKGMVEELGAEVVIFDSDLTPAQGAKLEEILGVKVLDRTQLILDIFAQRARTHEGRCQVELAQLRYLLPRLTGRGSIMRQQGGIGVRGPGEQKLEVDRRVIRERIRRLEAELETVRQDRQIQRKRRNDTGVFTATLVGYTNAGKSTLLNALTGADAFAEGKLFATLDPLVRRCDLPGGGQVLLADTVGFVRRLPHTLVAAFRATLEEVREAQLLLIVVDASHPAREEHISTVRQVLEEIKAADVPSLLVYNKIDLLPPEELELLKQERTSRLMVSATQGTGLRELLEAVEQRVALSRSMVTLRVPVARGDIVAGLHRRGRILRQKVDQNNLILEAEIPPALVAQLSEFLVRSE